MGRSRPGGSTRRSRARRISHGAGARRPISARTTTPARISARALARAGPMWRCGMRPRLLLCFGVFRNTVHYQARAPPRSRARRARAAAPKPTSTSSATPAATDEFCAMHSSRAASAPRAHAAVRAWWACDARGAHAARAQPKPGHLWHCLPTHLNCDANPSEGGRRGPRLLLRNRSFAWRHLKKPA